MTENKIFISFTDLVKYGGTFSPSKNSLILRVEQGKITKKRKAFKQKKSNLGQIAQNAEKHLAYCKMSPNTDYFHLHSYNNQKKFRDWCFFIPSQLISQYLLQNMLCLNTNYWSLLILQYTFHFLCSRILSLDHWFIFISKLVVHTDTIMLSRQILVYKLSRFCIPLVF